MHRPRPEQPPAQCGCEQSAPCQPPAHEQSPGAVHRPWLEHSRGQRGSHAGPPYPGLHTHAPSTQAPWPLQPCDGHGSVPLAPPAGAEQSRPPHPAAHTHDSGATQRPCAEHDPVHCGVEQSAPPQPGAHRQRVCPERSTPHTPLAPSHGGLHARLAQSMPPHPGAHLHTPGAAQWPWPEQSLRHDARSQSAPAHPIRHCIVAASQRPSRWQRRAVEPSPTEQSRP